MGWVAQVSLLTAGYVATGLIGMALGYYYGAAPPIWPPAGLALGVLTLYGRRLWPGVFLGMMVIGALDPRVPLVLYLAIASGGTLQVVVGATLLRRLRVPVDVGGPRDLGVFLLVGLGSTMIAPTFGVSTLVAGGLVAPERFLENWLNWWLGEVAGVIVATPLVSNFVYGTPAWRRLLRSGWFWLMLASLLATNFAAFAVSIPGVPGIVPLLACFPVLIWAGTTMGSRGAAIASAVVVLSAMLATVLRVGPFVAVSGTDQRLLLAAYAIMIGATTFSLAAIVEQRNRADRLRQREEEERLNVQRLRPLLEERGRLARDVHDGLGRQLVSLLSVVERGVGTRSEIAEALRRALDDIRMVIDSLDPETSHLPTSLGKLRARLEPLLRRNEITLSWHVDDDPRLDRFSGEDVLHLLRIIADAVTNSVGHAGATRVDVSVRAVSPWRLHVTIQDDGRGAGPDEPLRGRGIADMHTHARKLGALLRVDGSAAGTRIELRPSFPISPSSPT